VQCSARLPIPLFRPVLDASPMRIYLSGMPATILLNGSEASSSPNRHYCARCRASIILMSPLAILQSSNLPLMLLLLACWVRTCSPLNRFFPYWPTPAAATTVCTCTSFTAPPAAATAAAVPAARTLLFLPPACSTIDHDNHWYCATPARTLSKSSKRRRMPRAQDEEPVRPPDNLRALRCNHSRFQ
jgi:hypothetical protein